MQADTARVGKWALLEVSNQSLPDPSTDSAVTTLCQLPEMDATAWWPAAERKPAWHEGQGQTG